MSDTERDSDPDKFHRESLWRAAMNKLKDATIRRLFRDPHANAVLDEATDLANEAVHATNFPNLTPAEQKRLKDLDRRWMSGEWVLTPEQLRERTDLQKKGR